MSFVSSCNAAGILDLRNLAGTDNQTTNEAIEHNPGVEKVNTNFKNSKQLNKENIYPPMSSLPSSTSSKKQMTQSTTTASSSEHPTINSELNNLDQLLLEYLNFSKSINPQSMLSKPQKAINKKYESKANLVQVSASTNPKPVSVPTAAALQSSFNKTTRMITSAASKKQQQQQQASNVKKSSSSSSSQVADASSLNQAAINFRNKMLSNQHSRISSLIVNSTTSTTKPTTTTTTTTKPVAVESKKPNLPGQYKLKINDTLAKNLLDSYLFRSKFGLKPDEKVNILVLKRPIENDQSHDLAENRFQMNMYSNQNQQNYANNRLVNSNNNVLSSNSKFNRVGNSNLEAINSANKVFSYNFLNNKPQQQHFINLPISNPRTILQTSTPTTTLSWLSKLKAKLLAPKFERDQILKSFETPYDWSHVLSNQYKQGK